MLPRKEHIKMINQFHDRMESLDNQIMDMRSKYGDDTSKYDKETFDTLYRLTREYFELTSKTWPKLDDFLEYKVKFRIDLLKNEPPENWNQ